MGCSKTRPHQGLRRRSDLNLRALAAVAIALGAGVAGGALPPPDVPVENPITEAKRVLGKILFWEEQLSSSNTVACGTCHAMNRGGGDDRLVRNPGLDGLVGTADDVFGSPGVIRSDADHNFVLDPVFEFSPQLTGRAANSPHMAAFAPVLFWDGRAEGRFVDPQTGQVAIAAHGALESQAVGPPVSSVEMSHPGRNWDAICAKLTRVRPLALATRLPADVVPILASGPSYGDLFAAAFGDSAITARRVAFAIATYERTLIPDDTPFDRYLAGNPNGMTRAQIQGMVRFEAHNCAACHNLGSELLTDFSFRNIGLRPWTEDPGRMAITGDPGDRGKFKVPSLRNTWLKKTFMHNGQFETLAEVVNFYGRAASAPQQFKDNRDPEMNLIGPISGPDRNVMVDFMQNALTDVRAMEETFPFDRPILFSERVASSITIVGGGVPGTGGLVPQIIAADPPLLGNQEFRLGVARALGNASARLVLSDAPPVNGVLIPSRVFPDITARGTGAGHGIATQPWPLVFGEAQPGQVLYAQWSVDDPAAAGGVARSTIARLTFFCGTGGCPEPCDAIDLDRDRAVTINDLVLFLDAFDRGNPLADVDDDGDPARGIPNRAVDINDLLFFLARFDQGC